MHPKRISLTESRGNGSFFILKSGVQFWIPVHLGKLIAAPVGWQCAMNNIVIQGMEIPISASKFS